MCEWPIYVTEFVPLHDIPYIFLSPDTPPYLSIDEFLASLDRRLDLSAFVPDSTFSWAGLRPINRYVFLFHLSRPDPFRSSTGPSVRWSPFSPRMFSSLDSAAAPHLLHSTGSQSCFPFLHRTILHLFLSLVQRCGSLPWTLLRTPIPSPSCTI